MSTGRPFDPSRRELLKGLAAFGGVSLWPGLAAGAGGRAPGTLLQRAIPATGETIPAVGIGTARQFDVAPDASALEPLRAVMRRFIDQGGRVVDTSPMYGYAEEVIGRLLSGMSAVPDMFYATKVWTRGREAGIEQMERSMARMHTDVIDLMQVHNLVDTQTHLRTLRRWKDEGRVRYIGVTHYVESAFEGLSAVMRNEPIDFVQLPLNIARRRAADELLPIAADRGIAVVVNVPFDNGGLFRAVRGSELPAWADEVGAESWAQFFLKYILSHPAVTCVIPATDDPDHVVDNMRAGYGPVPDAKQRKRMVDYWERTI